MHEEPIDLLKIDAQYSPVEPFKKWSGCTIDLERWEHYANRIEKLKKGNEELLERSLEVVKKAAAIETGALENLYELPHGFTITAASQVAHIEAAFNESTEKARPYIQSQLDAYDMVLDFATRRMPIAEVWIRELHSQICQAQKPTNLELQSANKNYRYLKARTRRCQITYSRPTVKFIHTHLFPPHPMKCIGFVKN